MRLLRLLPLISLLGLTAWGDDGTAKSIAKPNADGVSANNSRGKLPRVLQNQEPVDNVVVTLPGPASKTVMAAPEQTSATIVQLQPPASDPDRPILRRAKRDFPAGFEQDSADFLHQRLGGWTEDNAKELLGTPTGSRSAYSDDRSVNGQIYSFDDPTGHYKSFELDFDKETGRLRTVFVYPLQMTWQECRRAFGANAQATQANKGRIFYSYVDRRLDVLVDQTGKVISLGMY